MSSGGKKKYSIALFIETSSTYGRQILRGIRRYIQTENKEDWLAVVEERDVNAGVPDWVRNWDGDGIVSRQLINEYRDEIKKHGIAFIELTDRFDASDFTRVRSDDEAIGRIAAEHFKERGLTNFAFCGFKGEAWSDRRLVGFSKYFESNGGTSVHSHHSAWYPNDDKLREAIETELIEWLKELPKPIGVMACNDVRGKQVIDACHKASLSIPESVAVLGVDNDDLLCSFCHPPLTSIIPNAEGIGFRSAEIMSQMLQNKSMRKEVEEIVVPPLGILARQSSDVVAVDDERLGAALKFIRNDACKGITVADVVKHVSTSRSTLERKMREFIGRTPQQEIRRVQLARVCSLLSASDLAIEAIAIQCGFDHPEYLHVVFKREMNMTPGEYRNAAGNY